MRKSRNILNFCHKIPYKMSKIDRKLDKNINAKWFNYMSHYGFGRFLNNGEKKKEKFPNKKIKQTIYGEKAKIVHITYKRIVHSYKKLILTLLLKASKADKNELISF